MSRVSKAQFRGSRGGRLHVDVDLSVSLTIVQAGGVDQTGVVTDADLAALASDHHHLDQGLAYRMRDYPDVFAYMLKAEGRIAHEHEEDSLGYITPPKLRERLADFEQLDVLSTRQDLGEQDLPLDYLEKDIASLRSFLRSATDNGYALLVVQTFYRGCART